MASTSTTSASLPCGQCGFLNEPERVYCHNCGSKLDRTLLPKGEEAKHEPVERTRKRIAKMTNPKSGSVLREIGTFFKVIIYAAIAAALYLVSQKPPDVPEVSRDLGLRMVNSELMEAVESPTARVISFTQDDVNDHLKRSLKAKDGGFAGTEFVRAYVTLHPGLLKMGTEQTLASYPLYSGIAYTLEVKDGKFTPTVAGGNFGRLSIDPRAMTYISGAFDKLFTALKRERDRMDRMQSVTIYEGRIDLVTKGASGR